MGYFVIRKSLISLAQFSSVQSSVVCILFDYKTEFDWIKVLIGRLKQRRCRHLQEKSYVVETHIYAKVNLIRRQRVAYVCYASMFNVASVELVLQSTVAHIDGKCRQRCEANIKAVRPETERHRQRYVACHKFARPIIEVGAVKNLIGGNKVAKFIFILHFH